MKKDYIDVTECVEETTTEVEEVKESKFKATISKVPEVIKKHKKIAVGAAIGVVGLVAYGLGKKSRDDDDCEIIDAEDYEIHDDAEESYLDSSDNEDEE